MQGKKVCVWLLSVLLLCALPLIAGAEAMRGFEKGKGYQYVQLGQYPYEADGTVKPVLWRVLDHENNQALLLTEYIIDTQQVIFEKDKWKIEKMDYRLINAYAESDLCAWLNTTGLDNLFGNNPIRNALLEEPHGGKLFIMTNEQFLTAKYGFAVSQWNDQPTRQAFGTPYATKTRGLYVDNVLETSSYWSATIKGPTQNRMALVGVNGHISWGGYTRQNVGLRLSVRLDMTQVRITGGSGTKDSPFILAYAGKQTATPQVTPTPVPKAATATPAVQTTPTPTAAPTAQATDNEILLSFLGDCSIGDSIQFTDYESSYHTILDEKGYAWPFSLVKEYLANDDLTIANLEVVLTNRRAHTDKMYNLIGAPDHVNALLEGSIEVVNTANNHCMDFKDTGYQDTLNTLAAAGVQWFGSIYPDAEFGFDDYPTRQVGDIRIGFIGFSYPQDYDKGGIASRIAKLKNEQGCDLVVVSLHWGRETHMTPATWQYGYAKEIIDSGADVIYGHHPHVIQPIQFYKGKPILYSTGNFTFGTMSQVDPSTGIFQLTYEKVDGQVQLKQLQVIPCKVQYSPDYRPIVLTDDAARKEVFRKLVLDREYNTLVNPPASFLETGVVRFENGVMLP